MAVGQCLVRRGVRLCACVCFVVRRGGGGSDAPCFKLIGRINASLPSAARFVLRRLHPGPCVHGKASRDTTDASCR